MKISRPAKRIVGVVKIVADRLRPPGRNDPHGVEEAMALIRQAYRLVDSQIGSRTWAMGDGFSLVDCAAAPALSYASTIVPFDESYTSLPAYLDRLMGRPSFARVLKEAEPYFKFFPMEKKPAVVAAAGRLGGRAGGPQ